MKADGSERFRRGHFAEMAAYGEGDEASHAGRGLFWMGFIGLFGI